MSDRTLFFAAAAVLSWIVVIYYYAVPTNEGPAKSEVSVVNGRSNIKPIAIATSTVDPAIKLKVPQVQNLPSLVTERRVSGSENSGRIINPKDINSDPIDPTWAIPTKLGIISAISAMPYIDKSKIVVTCKSTLCKLEGQTQPHLSQDNNRIASDYITNLEFDDTMNNINAIARKSFYDKTESEGRFTVEFSRIRK